MPIRIEQPHKDYAPTAVSYIQQFVNEVIGELTPDTHSPSSPNGRAATVGSTTSRLGGVQYAVVRYATPQLNSYLLNLIADHNIGSQQIIVARATVGGTQKQGARQHPVYTGGQVVLVCVSPVDGESVILCAVPDITGDVTSQNFDVIGAGEAVGAAVSPQYVDYRSALLDRGGVIPAPTDAPIDILPGDYTATSVTGNTLHIDDEMLLFRASELCGLSLFSEDGHARLGGESLRVESPSFQTEHGDAAGELMLHSQFCIYPWEVLGKPSPTTDSEVDVFDNPNSSPLLSGRMRIEPKHEGQAPLARIQEFGGYLGQGICRVVSAPHGGGINTEQQPTQSLGLSRQHTLLDGSLLLESARQVFIAKTAQLPTLQVRGRLDTIDLEASPYQFNGIGDSVAGHIVRQLSSEIPVAAGLAVEEMYSYLSAWSSTHAAVYHPNVLVRYLLPAYEEPSVPPSLNQADWISPESIAKAKIDVDHRLKDLDLYRILSFFSITETGDLVLQNGMGAAIRITAGGIFIEAGSVHVQAAKTVSVSGRNLSLRGYRAAEISSSQGPVLVKAETNLNMLGANSGRGGVLIESRSNSHEANWADNPEDSVGSGIVIKSLNSHVTTLGGNVLTKTGPAESGAAAGRILFDCAGEAIVHRCRMHVRHGNQMVDYMALPSPEDTELAPVNITTRDGHILTGTVQASNSIISGGVVEARRGFATHTGRYLSGSGQREISPGMSSVNDQVARVDEYRQQLSVNMIEQWVDLSNRVAAENRPLHPRSIAAARFGFHGSETYGTKRVTMPQPVWHRPFSGQLERWVEPVVQYRTQQMEDNYETTGQRETRPWPGQATWDRADSMLAVTGQDGMFNPASQAPRLPTTTGGKARYEAADIRGVEKSPLSQGALVLKTSDASDDR